MNRRNSYHINRLSKRLRARREAHRRQTGTTGRFSAIGKVAAERHVANGRGEHSRLPCSQRLLLLSRLESWSSAARAPTPLWPAHQKRDSTPANPRCAPLSMPPMPAKRSMKRNVGRPVTRFGRISRDWPRASELDMMVTHCSFGPPRMPVSTSSFKPPLRPRAKVPITTT